MATSAENQHELSLKQTFVLRKLAERQQVILDNNDAKKKSLESKLEKIRQEIAKIDRENELARKPPAKIIFDAIVRQVEVCNSGSFLYRSLSSDPNLEYGKDIKLYSAQNLGTEYSSISGVYVYDGIKTIINEIHPTHGEIISSHNLCGVMEHDIDNKLFAGYKIVTTVTGFFDKQFFVKFVKK